MDWSELSDLCFWTEKAVVVCQVLPDAAHSSETGSLTKRDENQGPLGIHHGMPGLEHHIWVRAKIGYPKSQGFSASSPRAGYRYIYIYIYIYNTPFPDRAIELRSWILPLALDVQSFGRFTCHGFGCQAKAAQLPKRHRWSYWIFCSHGKPLIRLILGTE